MVKWCTDELKAVVPPCLSRVLSSDLTSDWRIATQLTSPTPAPKGAIAVDVQAPGPYGLALAATVDALLAAAHDAGFASPRVVVKGSFVHRICAQQLLLKRNNGFLGAPQKVRGQECVRVHIPCVSTDHVK